MYERVWGYKVCEIAIRKLNESGMKVKRRDERTLPKKYGKDVQKDTL